MKNVSMNGIFSRNVEIFISLAKTKSFQKTASIFGLSTSSISRELVTLENKLKVTLVDRSCRPLILTPEGRKLLSERMNRNGQLLWHEKLRISIQA